MQTNWFRFVKTKRSIVMAALLAALAAVCFLLFRHTMAIRRGLPACLCLPPRGAAATTPCRLASSANGLDLSFNYVYAHGLDDSEAISNDGGHAVSYLTEQLEIDNRRIVFLRVGSAMALKTRHAEFIRNNF
jgi:hypothetical protein